MAKRSTTGKLTHVDARGHVQMVDVSAKPATQREAVASAVVRAPKAVLDAMSRGSLPKGDALGAARVAGILAAKRTAEWIPLCHPLPLAFVGVEFDRPSSTRLRIRCTSRTSAQTGVEMEAMTGAAAAALTIYDMVKSADKSVEIGPIRLEHKSGGKSGSFVREE